MLLLAMAKKEVKHEESKKLQEFGLRNYCQTESKRERDSETYTEDLMHKSRISFNNENDEHPIEV